MSTVGAFFGAQSQRDQLRHQANIAEINARIADGNARNIIRAGTIEESRVRMAGSRAKGAATARIASSGIDIGGSPTALARLTGTDLVTEVDATTTRANALRQAWGQRIEAGNLRRGAAALRGTADSISPLMAAGTSLMTSVGQVASSWYNLNREGAFDRAPRDNAGGAPADLLSNWGDLAPPPRRDVDAEFGRLPFGGRARRPVLDYGAGF